MRFLNRKIFLAVTLLWKDSRFQTGVMRSSRIRVPAFGALGRKSEATFSFNEE